MMGDDIVQKLLNLTEEVIENTEMDDSEDDEIILSLLDCVKSASGKRKKIERVWVKEWRRDRENRGTFSFIMTELIDDKSCFLNYLRMSKETFNFILSKIESDIKRQDTMLRRAITPEEKLAATLRYLATGESYKSTDYQTRLSSSFLCEAIPEVCEAIWKHFKDEFLRVSKNVLSKLY